MAQNEAAGQNAPAHSIIPQQRRYKPKLSEIKLLEFSGDFTKWIFFKNSFETTIHRDPDLTPMQKYQYLIGQLQGEARQVIQVFTISDDNYWNAWKLLKDTYDNTMLIIEIHLEALLQFSDITKENKADSIRQSFGVRIRNPLRRFSSQLISGRRCSFIRRKGS